MILLSKNHYDKMAEVVTNFQQNNNFSFVNITRHENTFTIAPHHPALGNVGQVYQTTNFNTVMDIKNECLCNGISVAHNA
jgi:Tfp pilus assembly protein FimT